MVIGTSSPCGRVVGCWPSVVVIMTEGWSIVIVVVGWDEGGDGGVSVVAMTTAGMTRVVAVVVTMAGWEGD